MNNPNTENQSIRTLYTITNCGFEHKIYLERTEYVSNNTLAVVATTHDGKPYATITANIDCSDAYKGTDYQYVDIKNCPWAPEFLERNWLAIHTGFVRYSGGCQYPLFKFNKDWIPVMPNSEEEKRRK